MGLDSVELVMEVENYFEISIPDSEAEKICTVQNMVDAVARHLNLTDNSTDIKRYVFERVENSLEKLRLINTPLLMTDCISKFLVPEDKDIWNEFESELKLKVPKPEFPRNDIIKLFFKIKYAVTSVPMYDWFTINVEQFVNALSACNCDKLIDRKHIRNTFEIYIAIVAITVNKMGIDYYEIAPEKSFTSDLGID